MYYFIFYSQITWHGFRGGPNHDTTNNIDSNQQGFPSKIFFFKNTIFINHYITKISIFFYFEVKKQHYIICSKFLNCTDLVKI